MPLIIRQWTVRHKPLMHMMRGAAQGSVAHSCALRFLPWAFQERNSRGMGCPKALLRTMPAKKSLLTSFTRTTLTFHEPTQHWAIRLHLKTRWGSQSWMDLRRLHFAARCEDEQAGSHTRASECMDCPLWMQFQIVAHGDDKGSNIFKGVLWKDEEQLRAKYVAHSVTLYDVSFAVQLMLIRIWWGIGGRIYCLA